MSATPFRQVIKRLRPFIILTAHTGLAVLFLVILLFSLILAINVPFIRQKALNLIEEELKLRDTKIELTNMTGIFPFKFRLDLFSFQDSDILIKAKAIEINLIPDFSNKQLKFKNLSSDTLEIVLLRQKPFGRDKDEILPYKNYLSLVAKWIQIDNFKINELSIADSWESRPNRFSVYMSALKTHLLALDFKIDAHESKDHAYFSFMFDGNSISNLASDINIDEDGPISRLTGLKHGMGLSIIQLPYLKEVAEFRLNLRGLLTAEGRISAPKPSEEISVAATLRLLGDPFAHIEPSRTLQISSTLKFNKARNLALSLEAISPNAHIRINGSDLTLDETPKFAFEAQLTQGLTALPKGYLSGPCSAKGEINFQNGTLNLVSWVSINGFSGNGIDLGPVSFESTLKKSRKDKWSLLLKNGETLLAKGLLDPRANKLKFDAELELSGEELVIRNLAAEATPFFLDIKGNVNLYNGQSDIDISLRSNDDFLVDGTLSLVKPAIGAHIGIYNEQDHSYRLMIDGNIDGISEKIIGNYEKFSDNKLIFKGSVLFSDISKIFFEELNIYYGKIALRILGNISIKDKLFSLRANLDASNFKPLIENSLLIKQADINMKAEGKWDLFSLLISSRLSGTYRNLEFEDVNFEFNGNIANKDIAGNMNLAGYTHGLPVSIRSEILLRGLLLQRLDLGSELGGTTLRGTIQRSGKIFTGELDLDISDSVIVGYLTKKDAFLKGKSRVQLLEVSGRQGIRIETDIREFKNDRLKVKGLKGMGTFFDFPDFNCNSELKISDLTLFDTYLGTAAINFNKTSERIEYQIATRDGLALSYSVISGTILMKADGLEILLKDAKGSLYGVNLNLMDEARIFVSDNELFFDPIVILFDPGLLRLRCQAKDNNVYLEINLDGLPMSLFSEIAGIELNGNMNGNMLFQGSIRNPDISSNISLFGLRIGHFEDMPSYQGTLRINGSNGLMDGKLDLDYKGKKILSVTAASPINIAQGPMILRLQDLSGLRLALLADIDLSSIGLAEFMPGKDLGGSLKADLELTMKDKDVYLNGTLKVLDFQFHDLKGGISLRDGQLLATMEGTEFRIPELAFRDLEKGGVAGSGHGFLRGEKGPEIHLEFRANNLCVVKREGIWGKVSGLGALTGTVQRPRLRGDLLIDNLDIDVSEFERPSVEELPVIEVRSISDRPARVRTGPIKRISIPLELDLNLLSKGTVRIRGKDMDSLWKGSFNITGEYTRPKINGFMELERGKYVLLGKTFPFTSGRMVFQGEDPPKPYLFARAEASTGESKGIAELSGPIDGLKLNLTSGTGLPPGEVFSRILFGKELSRLSPMQGIKVLELMSGGRGKLPILDIITLPQRLFGLDLLDIQEAEGERGQSIRAGKYLRENVYMEFDWGIEAEKGRIRLGTELTPNISVETQLGEKGAGAAINFKWDY